MCITIPCHFSSPAIAIHLRNAITFSLGQSTAFIVQMAILVEVGSSHVFPDELDLGAFEILAAINEPLNYADDDDDEESDDTVIWRGSK